jgi:hypothetical protein
VWVAAPGESRRRGASCVAYKNAVWQFGGVDLEGTVYNTTHRWTPEEGFQAVEARGLPPPPRWTHSACVVGAGMFVFGGFFGYGGTSATGRYNDLWRLDLERLTWAEVRPGDGSGPPPSVRSHHCAAALGDGKMYVFGGADEQRVAAEPAGDWTAGLLKTLGGGTPVAPPPEEFIDVLHNDLHEFDTATCTWRVVPISDAAPPPPGGITARLAVHGGLLYALCWRALEEGEEAEYDQGEDATDGIILEMACIDLAPKAPAVSRGGVRSRAQEAPPLPVWRRVPFGGAAPCARDLFSAAVWGDTWIVHAGRSVRGELLRDTWEFSFTRRCWRQLLARGASAGAVPDARYSHAACVLGNVMYVVGGSNSAQYAAAPRHLTQRCAAVEQLFLARTLAPSEDYVPVSRAPPPAPPPPLARRALASVGGAAGALLRALGYEIVWSRKRVNDGASAGAAAAKNGPGGARRIVVSDVNLLVQGRRFHTHSDILSAASERFAAILARPPDAVSAERAAAPLARAHAAAQRASAPPVILLLLVALAAAWDALVRLVLAARRTLFPRRARRLVLRDVSYDVMLVMMHFIYASPGEVPQVPPPLLEACFVASEAYGVAPMRAECLRGLVRGAALSNVARYAALAHAHACQELWDACVRFAAKALPEVVRTPGFQELWALNGHVAQMLTADAARELQVGAAASGKGRFLGMGRAPEAHAQASDIAADAAAQAASPRAGGGNVLLGARTVILDAQRATKARMDGMQAWLGVPPLMGVPPLAELLGGKRKPAAAKQPNKARAVR